MAAPRTPVSWISRMLGAKGPHCLARPSGLSLIPALAQLWPHLIHRFQTLFLPPLPALLPVLALLREEGEQCPEPLVLALPLWLPEPWCL